MPERLPVPLRHPGVLRAAVSPTAAVVTAAGVGIGFAAHSVTLAIALGASAWVARLGVAVARAARRPRRTAVVVDPWAVPEPWRGYVRQAQRAEQRFEEAVAQWPPGPVRERLSSLRPRLRQGVEEVWQVARRGAALGPVPAGDGPAAPVPGAPDAATLSEQLRAVQAERRRAAGDPVQVAALGRTEDAVASQLRAARRAERAAAGALDGLRALTARLDEAVTELLELGASGSDGARSGRAAEAIDSLAEEVAALRAGLESAGLSPLPAAGVEPALPAAGPVREDPTS